MIDTLAIVRSIVGRRHRISRQEMRDILVALGQAGLDLRNDCVSDTLDWEPYGQGGYTAVCGPQTPAQIERASRAWANMCKDITVISVLPSGAVPHGAVRYDCPGSMAPMQRAEIMFAPAELEGHEYDQIGQLRRKAHRVLVVADDPPIADPASRTEEPEDDRVPLVCDNGHRWRSDDPQRDWQCPTCGEPWV